MEMKTCPECGETKTADLFRKGRAQCKACRQLHQSDYYRKNIERYQKQRRERADKLGVKPMSESKDSPVYLGIYVAERALSKFFDHIERAPPNNPGFDFKCGKGKLIDAKSSCLRHFGNCTPRWQFSIAKNTIADYFLCLAFRDRETLEPMHVWLVPGCDVNDRKLVSVMDSTKGLAAWAKYERPLDKVMVCCTEIGKNL
jgi:hypothetical protein